MFQHNVVLRIKLIFTVSYNVNANGNQHLMIVCTRIYLINNPFPETLFLMCKWRFDGFKFTWRCFHEL